MLFVEAAEPDSISGAAGAAISGNTHTPSQRTPPLEATRTGSISVTLSGERGAIAGNAGAAGAAGAAGGGAEGSGRAAQDEWAVRSLLALLVQRYKF
jgi:hypothetical protein